MISRRDFFKLSLLALSLSSVGALNASTDTNTPEVKKIAVGASKARSKTRYLKTIRKSKNSYYILKMYNPNTQEVLVSRFPKKGKIPKSEHKKISYFLRDFHVNKVKEIDSKLIKELAELLERTKRGRYLVVHSGYRTKRTNKMLREHGYKTARKSMHIKAKAIDFHISGYSAKKSYKIANKIHSGGLGYYPGQKFIHLDTGRKRKWIS